MMDRHDHKSRSQQPAAARGWGASSARRVPSRTGGWLGPTSSTANSAMAHGELAVGSEGLTTCPHAPQVTFHFAFNESKAL